MKPLFNMCAVLSDPTFRVNMQKQEKKIVFLELFVLSKVIYEIVQIYNRYLHEVGTVNNHSIIIIRSLAYFCIESMASYMVAIVRAIYSYLVKTPLMTISLNVCGFLPLILIQLTHAS